MSLCYMVLRESRKAFVILSRRNIVLCSRRISSTVFGWGSNDAGELGRDKNLDSHLKHASFDLDEEVDLVRCGYGTTFLSNKSSFSVYAFGLNSVGQLGNQERSNKAIRKDCDGTVKGISAGRAHSLVLTDKGVFASGSNVQGQCGLLRDIRFTESLEKVLLPFDAGNIIQISSGLDNSLVLTTDGKIYSTGLGADGQTGLGHHECQYGFTQVAGHINNEWISQVSTTTDACLALTGNGSVYGWGNNELGQISKKIGDKQIAVPTQVLNSSILPNICQVFSGGSFSAILSDGDVYVKGYGALGLGPEYVDVDDFSKLELDKSFGKIVKISGSADYIAALTDTRKLLTWGRGNHGRLGHGDTNDQYFPREVNLPGPVIDFACGNDHMVSIVALDE
ncbi:RCC1-like G exchanging factor-like protein isoform X2 [Rhopilema esculentum]|uniref:RCC1-like G exchanging factor-like protein isoform X2 n=1 Tax=Rhopilema esculentum TaxID=499914 RepID=UPI0031DD678C